MSRGFGVLLGCGTREDSGRHAHTMAAGSHTRWRQARTREGGLLGPCKRPARPARAFDSRRVLLLRLNVATARRHSVPTGARVAGLRGWPVDAADRRT